MVNERPRTTDYRLLPTGLRPLTSSLNNLGSATLRVPWLVRVSVFTAYAALLTWLLLAPATVVTRFYPNVPWLDKVLHFCLFGFLVLLARWGFPDPRALAFPAVLIPLLALGYGAATEVTQGLLVKYHRSFEWADIVANSLGAASFWLLSTALFRSR